MCQCQGGDCEEFEKATVPSMGLCKVDMANAASGETGTKKLWEAGGV